MMNDSEIPEWVIHWGRRGLYSIPSPWLQHLRLPQKTAPKGRAVNTPEAGSHPDWVAILLLSEIVFHRCTPGMVRRRRVSAAGEWPTSYRDLAKLLGVSRRCARKTLRRLRDVYRVVTVEIGEVWGPRATVKRCLAIAPIPHRIKHITETMPSGQG